MSRGGRTGAALMLLAAAQMLLFVIGVRRRSYLALALPVGAAMVALSALTFWFGWTMATMGDEEEEDATPAEPSLMTGE